MNIQEDAVVTVLLADHIAVDPSGKVNALGLGVNLTPVGQVPMGPQVVIGSLAPIHLLLLIEVPSKYAGVECSVSIELCDETTGRPVMVPGPQGPEPLRIQQLVRLERFAPPQGVYLPGDLPIRAQLNVGLSAGLPLEQGHNYVWQVQLDGQGRKHWQSRLHVLGPPPGPVLGGPTGPSHIPNVAPLSDEGDSSSEP